MSIAKPDDEPKHPARRFDRGARLTLAFALIILGVSAAQVAYRYFLPTDGWAAAENPEVSQIDYLENIVGAPSELQPGDAVIAVEGTAVDAIQLGVRPPYWYVGNEVTYETKRADRTQIVLVPVVRWTPRSIIRANLSLTGDTFFLLGTILLVIIGFLAFIKRPADRSTRALLIFVAALGAMAISGLVPDGLTTMFDPIAVVTNTFFSYFIFGTLLAPALLAFTLVFPQPKAAIRRRPWLAYVPFLFGALILIALVLTGAWQPGWYGTMVMFVAALLSLIHSALTMRDAVSRAQLLWAFGGLGLGIGLFLLNFRYLFGWTIPSFALDFASGMAIPVMGLGMAMAVLRYRLFDIDVIIRRTTAYLVLTALLALVYFGSVVLLQRALAPLTGDSTIAVVLSTLLIAALFLPLRRRVQDAIDRRFFRRKYDAAKTLEAFAATVRNETDLDALTAELVRVIQETMQPESISVWLKPVARTPRSDE